jgi:branched-chain amino acid transport system ATP-binding protein
LSVRGLTVDYGSGPVVKGIDLDVSGGTVALLAGANGAGKSSTLRAIAGLIPGQGRVELLGSDVSRLNAFRRARSGIYLVPDERGIFPSTDVRDHLWLSYPGRKRPHGDTIATVFDLFPILAQRQRQHAGSLSGGERRMLHLAMAVLRNPRVLLIDELSLGLAPMVTQTILRTVREMATQLGIGVLLVEQFVWSAMAYADQGHIMSTGSIVLSGEGSELLERRDDVVQAYFGESTEPSGGSEVSAEKQGNRDADLSISAP